MKNKGARQSEPNTCCDGRRDALAHIQVNSSLIFLLIAMVVGGYIRLSQVLASDFPFNDGGMFYTMTLDLIANNFQLPLITSYNSLNIPFAYPPLCFYMAGFLSTVMQWALLDVLRVLPAVFTVLAIPTFYLLARRLTSDEYQLIFATLIFTFLPASFDWLIMGGGLTRAPAFFFALLALFFTHRLYTQDNPIDIFWTALFSAFTVFSHPETALHSAVSALLFLIFFGRNKKGVQRSLMVAVLVLLLTAPWWVTVLIMRHGFTPFLAAGGTGFYNFNSINRLIQFDLTHEFSLQSIGVLGLIGLFWQLAKRRYFLPTWSLIIFLSEPRSAPLYLSPCLALLASFALVRILQSINDINSYSVNDTRHITPLSSGISKSLFGLLFAQWVYSAMATVIVLLNTSVLTTSDKETFEWIRNNTPPESRFLVLTGEKPLTDPVSEWFPALTGRVSVATAQGNEWKEDTNFENLLTDIYYLQKCIHLEYDCIESRLPKNIVDFDYIYIHAQVFEDDDHPWQLFKNASGELYTAQGITELVYDDNEVAIYRMVSNIDRDPFTFVPNLSHSLVVEHSRSK